MLWCNAARRASERLLMWWCWRTSFKRHIKDWREQIIVTIFSRLDNKFVLNHARLLTRYENSFLSHHHHSFPMQSVIPSQVTGEWSKFSSLLLIFCAAQRHWDDMMLMLMMMQIKLFIIIHRLAVIFHHESDRLESGRSARRKKRTFHHSNILPHFRDLLSPI